VFRATTYARGRFHFLGFEPSQPPASGLLDPMHEHDACGVGFVVDIKGRKSHTIVQQAIQVLKNLAHRGACGCEINTGDGAGILVQMPDTFLRKVAPAPLPPAGDYGCGLVFLPQETEHRAAFEQLIARVVAEEGQTLIGWRDVPSDDSPVGPSAVASNRRSGRSSSARAMVRAACSERRPGGSNVSVRHPKRVEYAADAIAVGCRAKMFYIVSLSPNTIYKGMLTAGQLEPMFPDLTDPDLQSALALVHQRFSTNVSIVSAAATASSPQRGDQHADGNINWMRARETAPVDLLGDDLKKILPVIREGGSDTATFDNVEFVMTGRSLPHAILMMIEPWRTPRCRPSSSVLRLPLVAHERGRPA
jgi:glutamate synthase (ferredoxin)